MNREKKLVKNTFILSIGTFLPKLASFITLPILTACLSKEQYGAYDLVTILVSLLLPITTLQIHTAGFRFLIEHKNDREQAKLYFSNILVFIVPVSIIVLSVTFFFLPIKDNTTKLWICVYLFFDTVVAAVRQIARGMGRNIDYSVSAIISAFIKMLLALLLVQFAKYELLGAIIALALSPVFSLIYLIIKLRLFKLFDTKLVSMSVIKEMLSYSWPMVPNNMSAWVMRVSDRIVVTAVMGIQANAVYAVANKIPNLLHIAQSTFAMAWQENASIVSKDKDASEYYSSMFRTMFDLMAGFFGVLISATPVLFKMLVKGDYSDAYLQMPILFIGMFFHSLATYLGGIYVAYMKSKSVGITTSIAGAVNLVTDIATIKFIGLYAASGSTLIAYVFLFVYRIIDVQKIITVKVNWRHSIVVIIIIFMESTLCYLQKSIFNIINIIFGLLSFYLLNRIFVKKAFGKVKKMVGARKSEINI